MDPVYSFMPSYPYPRDQMQYGPNYFPGTEVAPPHMFMNPARPHPNYEHWPRGSNYGYPHPVACQGCCNHGYFPGQYAWGSPYSHVPPAHYPGSYPHFPNQYVPPPPYALERPWYGYDKDSQRHHHCCGCPNHHCNQKEQKNLKIEEEEPDTERKKDDSRPPFPLVWLPPDYDEDKTKQISGNSEHKDRKDGQLQKPGVWNGWRPFELRDLVSPMKNGKKSLSSQQTDSDKEHLPFPVFWMPYRPEEKEKERPEEKEKEQPREENANPVPRLQSVKGSGKHAGDRLPSVLRDIPVNKVEEHDEIVNSRDKRKGSDTSLKEGADNEDKTHKDDPKRKPSSPKKSSKLPPVCLRVDPLPRRKTANGSSRSPSPPRDKQKMDQHSSQISKVPGSSGEEKPDKMTKDELKANKGVTKTIQVVEGKSGQGESSNVEVADTVNHHLYSQADVVEKPTGGKKHKAECMTPDDIATKAQSTDGAKGEVSVAVELRADKEKEPRKAKLSEEEAAVIIQAAYRGFDIRRWEPVKKLKQIAKVRERIAEVKDLIRAMELSTDIQGKRKQQTIIAETIMSLLLDLDTIQGLHPSIREVRKSVVRELVTLQEKLDSITYEKSEASIGQESNAAARDEEASKETTDASLQNSREILSDLVEPCPKQLDEGSHNGISGISKTVLIGEQLNTKLEEGTTEVSESQTIEDAKLPSETAAGTGEVQNKQIHENGEVSVATPGKSSECLFSQNNFSMEVTDYVPDNEDKPQNELPELPLDVSCDFIAQEGTKDGKLDADISKVDQATNKQEEGLVEVYTSELENGVGDGGKLENMEEILDIPVDVSDVKYETTETNLSKLDDGTQEAQYAQVYTSEPGIGVIGEGHESMDLGIPVEEVDVKLEAEEPDLTRSNDTLATTKEADQKTGDISFEHDSFSSQSPQGSSTDFCSDEKEHPVETGKVETCDVSNGDPEMSDSNTFSVSGEAVGTSSEKNPNLELEAVLFKEPSGSHEAAAIDGVNEEAGEKLEADQIVYDQSSAKEKQDTMLNIDEHAKLVDGGEPQITEASFQYASCEACRGEKEGGSSQMVTLGKPLEHFLPEENFETQNAANDVLSTTEIQYPGANNESICNVNPSPNTAGKELSLIEENEKLRSMVEKLIKSGEEQMNVISSLSGRVKDLERNLSKKKKLKMRRYGARRSSSVHMNSSKEQTTAGVVM